MLRVRVKYNRFIQRDGRVYLPGDTFDIQDDEWNPDGIGQMVDIDRAKKSMGPEDAISRDMKTRGLRQSSGKLVKVKKRIVKKTTKKTTERVKTKVKKIVKKKRRVG